MLCQTLPAVAPCLPGLGFDVKECSAPRCTTRSAAWPIVSTPSGPAVVVSTNTSNVSEATSSALSSSLSPEPQGEAADRPPIVLEEPLPLFLRAAGCQALDERQMGLRKTHDGWLPFKPAIGRHQPTVVTGRAKCNGPGQAVELLDMRPSAWQSWEQYVCASNRHRTPPLAEASAATAYLSPPVGSKLKEKAR